MAKHHEKKYACLVLRKGNKIFEIFSSFLIIAAKRFGQILKSSHLD